MSGILLGEAFRLRPAGDADVPYLTALAAHGSVRPYLAAVSPWGVEETPEGIRLAQAEPAAEGRFVVELDEGGWRPSGAVAFSVWNRRVQLEVYGYNDRALRLFPRAGFVREGVRRKAYWRDGDWQDGVMFGLVEEDIT